MNDTELTPDYELFSKAQVGIATFLGSPLAGAILMSRNARAIKHIKEAANSCLLIGFISTVAIVALSAVIPE